MGDYKCLDRVFQNSTTSVNPNYKGPNINIVKDSVLLRSTFIDFLGEFEYIREFVLKKKLQFVDNFFKAIRNQKYTILPEWIEACKKRERDLFKLYQSIVTADNIADITIITLNNRGEESIRISSDGEDYKGLYTLDQLKWCPNKFKLVTTDGDEVIDLFISSRSPKIFSSLFVAMFQVAYTCTMCNDPQMLSGLQQLALSIIEVARLYNETDPDPVEWHKQELETLRILTNPPTKVEDEELDNLLIQVCQDIEEGRLPYIRDFHIALRANKSYIDSPFSDDDYYISAKGSPSKYKGFKYSQSILKSIYEYDPFKGSQFDKEIGYESSYLDNEGDPDLQQDLIRTIHIPNPAKFKTRAIHYAVNPIQDRCSYINNRIMAFLNSLRTDCTKDQDKGRAFTRKVTNPSFRENSGWPGVYAFDWSNATDRLDQTFQQACLSILFEPHVVQFWEEISSLQKVFRFKGKSQPLVYDQLCGQPQGLLGSFSAFALAHHVIMLMTMKLSNREDKRSEDFYRILGDDSIICTVDADLGDKVANNYARICAWANVPINLDKSNIIRSIDRNALVDFAKVFCLNGQYMSPIPSRLANRIASPDGSYYAITSLTWQARYSLTNPSLFFKVIDLVYTDPIENAFFKVFSASGISSAYDDIWKMYKPDLDLRSDPLVLRLALYYAKNKILASLLSNLIGDKDKEILDFKRHGSLIQNIRECDLLPKDLEDLWQKVPTNHKINIVINRNLAIEDLLSQLFDLDLDQIRLLSLPARLSSDEISSIQQLINLFDLIQYEPDLSEFKHSVFKICTLTENLSRFTYRSWYKSRSLDTCVLDHTIKGFIDEVVQSDSTAFDHIVNVARHLDNLVQTSCLG